MHKERDGLEWQVNSCSVCQAQEMESICMNSSRQWEVSRQIEENEVMLMSKNTMELKSLDTQQRGEWCHHPWEKQCGHEDNWNSK